MINIERVWTTEKAIWIRTKEGQEYCEKFADYPRLKYADKAQLENFKTDEFGIHWPELDEDLSFEGFLEKPQTTELYRLFMEHPELNVSSIARRMGISQSLMAQYVSGIKKISDERLQIVKETFHQIGRELIAV
ncbi:MAG: DUF2442 domain-containing protein [Bacteroidaceae bacterium]|nr:DUF2442 domain-containing protein [Bacteroidaceae bacterium]